MLAQWAAPLWRRWLRSLFWPPSFRRDRWAIWQFHDAGTRAAINGPVDLNVFRGSRRQFGAFVSDEQDRRLARKFTRALRASWGR